MEPEPPIEEIHEKGLLALREALGRDGMIRFLQQFDKGSGDYAKERHAWVDNTSWEELLAQTNLGKAHASLGKKKKKRA